MLWDIILNMDHNMALYIDYAVLFANLAWIAVIFMQYKKQQPWANILAGTGKSVAIIVDKGLRLHFVSFRQKAEFDILKQWGVRSLESLGAYSGPRGTRFYIFWSRVAINIPIQFGRIFSRKRSQDARPIEEQLAEEDMVHAKCPNCEQEFLVRPNPVAYQVLVQDFENFIGYVLSSLYLDAEVRDMSRGLAKLKEEQLTQKGGINMKFVMIAGVIIIIVLVVFFVLGPSIGL